MQPPVQVREVDLEVLAVSRPRHPVHPRSGLRADRPVGLLETVDGDVVQQRREPCTTVSCCYFAHTVQPTVQPVGHVRSGSASGTCRSVRVPLGQPPFLHHLRNRPPGLVRWLRRYYGVVRFPAVVHLRIVALAFPERPAR